jgi:hypothetical protein
MVIGGVRLRDQKGVGHRSRERGMFYLDNYYHVMLKHLAGNETRA